MALAVMLMGGVSLSACATVQPRDHGPRISETARENPRRADRSGRLPGTMRPYRVAGVTYTPREQRNYNETGMASWYGAQFHNRSTANGETFDMDRPSAAHTTLPLPSLVEVTDLDTGRSIRVRVNDRGPFVRGRIIDLSRAAAQQLGIYSRGTARVRVRYLGPADRTWGDDARAARNEREPRRREDRRAREDRPLFVQAGMFSTRVNAERAAGDLSQAGVATIDTIERGGATLYRVTLGPAPDARAARRMRDQAAGAGYRDARIVGF